MDRTNLFQQLSISTQNYIKSITTDNNLSEIDTQLATNIIPISNNLNITTSVATDIVPYKKGLLPIIIYNSKEWRYDYPLTINIELIEKYNSLIYNTCILYLKNGQQKLANILILLFRTLFILISEINDTPSEINRKNICQKIHSPLKKNKDISIYKNKLHPSDWYWCIYSILEKEDDLLPINLSDIMIGLITQPFLGRNSWNTDKLEYKLFKILLMYAIKNINHMNLHNYNELEPLIKGIHQNVGIKFEEFLICNGFIIEILRNIFLNPDLMKIYYGENICQKLLIRHLSNIRYIYTNLRGLTTLCISIAPNLYQNVSELNLAEMIAEYLYTKNINFETSSPIYLSKILQDNRKYIKHRDKSITKLCHAKLLLDYYTKPHIQHNYIPRNRNKLMKTLLPFILNGNNLDAVKEIINDIINKNLMGEKKLMRIIHRFAPMESPIREYFKHKLPNMTPYQIYIYPKWLKEMIKNNKQLNTIIDHNSRPLNIPYVPIKDAINIFSQSNKHLTYQATNINNTCLMCLEIHSELEIFHDNHKVCKTCYYKLDGKCIFCY